MIPKKLFSIIQCPECKESNLLYIEDESRIVCHECCASFPEKHGIPSMMKGGPENQDWNPWDLDKVKMMGDSYYKRASGELPEKEASKSCARFLKNKNIYSPGDRLLDIGCASGHFLRSFRRFTDPDISYTGIDAGMEYLQWGGQVYGLCDSSNFLHCDALEMPFKNMSFDIVVVNLFHFFPRLDHALREAMRVAKKTVLWRTPIGAVNYMIKVIYNQSFDEIGALSPDRNDFDHSLYMLYSKEYIHGIVRSLGGKVDLIERDTDFEQFDNTKLEEFKHIPSTKTVGDLQINGSLLLDWHYVMIVPVK